MQSKCVASSNLMPHNEPHIIGTRIIPYKNQNMKFFGFVVYRVTSKKLVICVCERSCKNIGEKGFATNMERRKVEENTIVKL